MIHPSIYGLVTRVGGFCPGFATPAFISAWGHFYKVTIVGDGSTAGGKLASAQGGGGGASEAFKTISVSGQDDVVAELEADTLTLTAGTDITLTTNASTDTVTITNSYSAPAETDPIFIAHDAYNVTAGKITSWDTAFGWGNHAQTGYLTNQSRQSR